MSMPESNLPLNYQNMLSLLLVSNIPGVDSYFHRGNVLVPAGSSLELTETLTQEQKANVVYLHTLAADLYTNNLLVTMQVDDKDPVFEDTPMSEKIELQGTFLPPVDHKITYTLYNNDSQGINFYADLQMIVFTPKRYKEIYEPLQKMQTNVLLDLIKESTGTRPAV